ncbi:MAG: hypothetical protein ACON4P_06060 [Candidatus Puniceispirillales bacterium]
MTPDSRQGDLSSSSLHGDTRIGLVDIGSNSIRLVIYRAGGRLPHPQFNEREVCRLGLGLAETGRLATDRIEHALQALARFAIIIRHSKLDRLDVFATEAVRKASNKDEFLTPAEALLGQPIRVLEGVEEALYAARGVISGFVYVDGIVADLGGGSLELTRVSPKSPPTETCSVSLPIGHLVDADEAYIQATIAGVNWLQAEKKDRLYVVGGTWRAIATAYTSQSKKRVDIVHGLTLRRKHLDPFLEQIVKAEGEVQGIPPARRGSMVQAIRVLRGLMDVMGTEKIVFSSYGAREGFLYEDLDHDAKEIDPLLAGAAEYGEMSQRFDGLGKVLVTSMNAFIGMLPESHQRLARGTCWLADISWLEYPDYRGSLAVEKMLGMSVTGISHPERVWMAAVLSIRYTGVFPKGGIFRGLLTQKERKQALFIGLALRMLMSASGGIPSIIASFDITAVKKKIIIRLPHDLQGLDTPLLTRRLDAISTSHKVKINLTFV